MSRRYVWLLAGTVALALTLTALGRAPSSRPARRDAAPAPASAVAIALRIEGGAVMPSPVRLEKGARVTFTITNADPAPAAVSLPGYEDRFSAVVVPPGGTRVLELLADRPGEDFPWIVNGNPAGRLEVAGSHLVEGHR